MWEWSEEFRQIQPHHLSNRVHLDMLIVDTHADRLKLHDFSALKKALSKIQAECHLLEAFRSYDEIHTLLERWHGFLSDRATIVVRLLHGSCNGCEAARALYDFASQSSDEVCIGRLVRDASFVSQREIIFGSRVVLSGFIACKHNTASFCHLQVHSWIPISNSDESDQMFILWRDRHLQGWDASKALPCWGCKSPSSQSVGGKWDVPGVYINVDEKREHIMQGRIQRFAPQATLRRFQGKLGAHERVCQDVGDTEGYVEISPSTVCVLVSHWLAIHKFLQDNATSGDYFLIAEDDITFDFVPFWPGPLSELLDIATASHPEWQIINLAPASWRNVTPWIMRSYFHGYDLNGGRDQLYWGAILYAIKKSDELAE